MLGNNIVMLQFDEIKEDGVEKHLPGVFLRLIDDKALSVGASLLLEQNSEQTSAAEIKSNSAL